jgi:hypothetical protein
MIAVARGQLRSGPTRLLVCAFSIGVSLLFTHWVRADAGHLGPILLAALFFGPTLFGGAVALLWAMRYRSRIAAHQLAIAYYEFVLFLLPEGTVVVFSAVWVAQQRGAESFAAGLIGAVALWAISMMAILSWLLLGLHKPTPSSVAAPE